MVGADEIKNKNQNVEDNNIENGVDKWSRTVNVRWTTDVRIRVNYNRDKAVQRGKRRLIELDLYKLMKKVYHIPLRFRFFSSSRSMRVYYWVSSLVRALVYYIKIINEE